MDTNGFDMADQKEAASIEDDGVFVHIHGLNDQAMYYTPLDAPDDGETHEVPVGITITGTHSKRFREIDGRQKRRRLKAKDFTGARVQEDNIEKVAYCTISWQGILDHKKEVRCDNANATTLFTEHPWLLEQLSEAMADHERFTESR